MCASREKLPLVVLQSERRPKILLYGPLRAYYQLSSEKRGEAGPRIGFRPLHPTPPRCRTGMGSTKRIDNASPPL
jgi:hypothetical protein